MENIEKKPETTLLLVAHETMVIQIFAAPLMREGYKLLFARSGDDAIKMIEQKHISLMIIDQDIKGLSAFEVNSALQTHKDKCDIPVLFLITHLSKETIETLYESGAVDYMLKEFAADAEIITKITHHLRQQTTPLQQEMQRKKEERELLRLGESSDRLKREDNSAFDSQHEIIMTLCSLTERRSNEKASHVRNVAEFSYLMAVLLGLDHNEATLLKMAAPMHDIGNLAISDSILSKPEKLNMQEFEKVEAHTILGHDMLRNSSNKVLQLASIIALQHHEKYNGLGYPNGLKGDDIDLYARIVAIADVFDTLSNDRSYDTAWDDADIKAYIKAERAKHFDPTLVDLFFKYDDQFFELREKRL